MAGVTNSLDFNKFETFFMEPIEKFVAVLGNNYVQNFLSNGTISKGFAVVSNKRVYFKGTAYSKQGKKLYKSNEEQVVDLKDVTGTGYIRLKRLWMLLSSIGFCILSIIAFILMTVSKVNFNKATSHYSLDNAMLEMAYKSLSNRLNIMFITSLVLALLLFLFYLIKRLNLFEISYAGGKICFDTVWYDKSEIDDFQRQLRLAKDNIATQHQTVEKEVQSSKVAQESHVSTIAEQIRKYSELLKEGLITQEEYDKLKGNIIN